MKLQQLIKPTSLSRGFALILSLIMLFGILGGNAPHAKAATNDFPCYGTVVNAPSGLILRKSASTTSDVLDVVPNGTDVKIVGIEGQWFRTEYGNNVGYLRSDYVELIGIVANANAYGGLMRRKGPGTNFDGLGRVPDGTRIRILRLDKSESGSPWYFGVCNGEECYVSAAYIKLGGKAVDSSPPDNLLPPESPKNDSVVDNTNATVVNVSTGLNIRPDASTDHTAIGSYKNNQRIQVTGKIGVWYQILHKGTYCYVHSNYVKVDNGVQIPDVTPKSSVGYIKGDFVNVRSGAGTNYLDIGDLYFGTQIVISGEVNGWYTTPFNSAISYVSASLVETNPKALCGMAVVTGADVVCTYYSRSATSDNISTRVIRGSILQVLETYSGGWAKVNSNGRITYIPTKYLDYLSYEEYANLPKGEIKKDDTIASYSYSFAGKDKNAIKNIKSGASFVTGTIIYPGETFDYYGITHPKGFVYEEAPVIVGGKYSTSRGGGLCFLSSTIYGAIQSAEDSGIDTGLNVTARFPHSKNPGYVYEAAISSYYQTFAFCNVNTYPVKVIAEISGNSLKIRIVKV